MKKRLRKINVKQASLMAAVIWFFVTLLILVPFALFASIAGGVTAGFSLGGRFLLFVPFLYAIFGFISTAISCTIYNAVAKSLGGIEVEIETVE